MNILFNGTIIPATGLAINFSDRAFMYGDGLFETFIMKDGEVRFMDFHVERLLTGMKAFSLEVPSTLNAKNLADEIKKLVAANSIQGNARIKLQVWRKPGGLYIPVNNEVNSLLTSMPLVPRMRIIKNGGIAKKVFLSYSPYSSLKTCNALPYVMAGLEMQERALNEIILLDSKGNLSECSSSNLFWIKNGTLYTPTLNTGCIAGIMRRYILEQVTLHKIEVKEVEEKPETLFTADQVFCCNVTGLYYFQRIEDTSYATSPLSEIEELIA